MIRALGQMSAAQVVKTLGMRAHPEGGWFVESWRAAEGEGRASGSAIYYLLEAQQFSRWHRVDADEIWHWYGGAPLELRSFDGPGPGELVAPPASVQIEVLGSDLLAGERPQIVIRGGRWQRAVTRGAFTLVGCTVSPAFEYEHFELAPEGWGT